MREMRRAVAIVAAFGLAACQRSEEKRVTAAPSPVESVSVPTARPGRHATEQVTPPVDLKTPPLDAIQTASGLMYKKLTRIENSERPRRNDTAMLRYTGWRQDTGETFFSNSALGQPTPLPLANTAPGFAEALQLIGKGEKAVLWIPPSLGSRTAGGQPPKGAPVETLVYEVELVDFLRAPEIPVDLGKPPATARTLASGIKYVVVKPATSKEKARYFDTVAFNYSVWDETGRMFDSTEMRKRPATVPPFRQSRQMQEILLALSPGERARFWIASDQMQSRATPAPGMPSGILTYEVELVSITKNPEPWHTPPDVAAPPATAKKTERGVFYKMLATGRGGPKPGHSDTVRVKYTGWTTDGRMFDSSLIKGEPAALSLESVIVGWKDAIPLLSVGDRIRLWVPDMLAYAGAPGKPQGMLVFDVELVDIQGSKRNAGDAQAPPDVAAPPPDAGTSPRGVAYKILKSVPNAPHPKATDTISVRYTGWQTDGTMFDRSADGASTQFSLQRVIAGWADVFPMIGVGEKARMWVPEPLAYPGGGGPSGMLVFEVELVEIKSP